MIMKRLKLIVLALSLMIGASAMAQGPQGQQGGQRQRMTPEQRAKAQTERTAKSLELSDAQQKKLYDYNLATIKKQQEEREKMMGNREDMQRRMEEMRNMTDEQRQAYFQKMQKEREAQAAAEDKAMKEILNADQYKKWQKQKKQQEARMRERMQGGGFGGPQGGGFGGPGGGQGGFGGGPEGGFGGGF